MRKQRWWRPKTVLQRKGKERLTSLFSLQEIPRIISKAFRTNLFLIIRTYEKKKKIKLKSLTLKCRTVEMPHKELTIRLSWRISRETFSGRSFESTTPFTKLRYLGNWWITTLSYQIVMLTFDKESCWIQAKYQAYQFTIKVIWNEHPLNIQPDILSLPISYVLFLRSRHIKNWPEFYFTLHKNKWITVTWMWVVKMFLFYHHYGTVRVGQSDVYIHGALDSDRIQATNKNQSSIHNITKRITI
jgi:hypothetical protein